MSSCHSQTSAQGHKNARLPYQYKTLDHAGKEIRVLEVLPGSKEEPLRAKFVRVFLSKQKVNSYETISYAWGDHTQRGEIQIDESVIDITASSGAALRCMRRPDKPRRLWIDAVCINQDEDQEKSFQVQMMGEVYRRSIHNLVCLGEEDDTTKSAMASINRALDELNTRLNSSKSLSKIIRHDILTLKCELDLAAMSHFFERPWFRRMWVVQEVVFAPASTCYCGAEICIDLVSLLRASSYINARYWESVDSTTMSLLECTKLQLLVDPGERICVTPKEDAPTITGERDSLELLELGCTRLCTDPRDRIFSIVGLIEQVRAKTPREGDADLTLVEVDYEKCYKDVLRDATRFCIQESRSLKVWHTVLGHQALALRYDHARPDEVCSWVPMDSFKRRWERDLPYWIDPRADADLPTRRETAMTTIFDPNVLTLDGYAVMDVVEVSQLLEGHLFEPDARLADMLTSIHRMCRGAMPSDPTRPNGVLECLARTLVMLPYQGSWAGDDFVLEMQRHLCNVFESGSRNDESKYWSKEAELRFKFGCSGRRIFTGSNGYIGQGPSDLRTGDRIVVLLGGDVPYAVRPLRGGDGGPEDRYQRLGPVYVYGAMYGEVVEAAKARGEEPSLFHFV